MCDAFAVTLVAVVTTLGVAIRCGHNNGACFGAVGCLPSEVDPSPTSARSFSFLLHAAFFFTGAVLLRPNRYRFLYEIVAASSFIVAFSSIIASL